MRNGVLKNGHVSSPFGEQRKRRATERTASDGAVGDNAVRDEATGSCEEALSTEKKISSTYRQLPMDLSTLSQPDEKPSEIAPAPPDRSIVSRLPGSFSARASLKSRA
jgi:hypothetical protein